MNKVKYIVIGSTCVGKTALINYYVDRKTTDTTISNSTIGVEFCNKKISVNDLGIRLAIWDTAGQERFKSITTSYYRNTDGAFVCFSIINRSSFQALDGFLEELQSHAPGCYTILVGTFSDQNENRTVSYVEAASFAAKHKLQYVEVSSVTGDNIDQCFELMAYQIYINIKDKQIDAVHPITIIPEDPAWYHSFCSIL